MNYLCYLKQPHYLALFCGVLSALLAFVESKYSKEKHPSKYYLKIFILVVINVYAVLILVKRGVVPGSCSTNTANQSGGGVGSLISGTASGVSSTTTPSQLGGGQTSINTSNYQTVDIGNPNF